MTAIEIYRTEKKLSIWRQTERGSFWAARDLLQPRKRFVTEDELPTDRKRRGRQPMFPPEVTAERNRQFARDRCKRHREARREQECAA